MSKRRVVITGLGMLSPVGNTVASTWEAIKSGTNGIGMIEKIDASLFGTQFAGELKQFNAADFIPKKDLKKMDDFIQYGVVAGQQAMRDANLIVTDANAERIGCAIGAGIGGLTLIAENHTKLKQSGPRKVSPFFVPSTITNMLSGFLSIMEGLKGPNLSVVTACTTGVHNIGMAARLIAYGDADAMLAGGAEAPVTDLGLAGFSAARALSTRNDDPAKASRPWDKDRDGFVMGEGAGILVLEEYEHAVARNAKIYSEVVGFGMSGDAHHLTAPPENGEGAALAMKNAFKDAGITPEQVGHINAHGTSTPVGDLAEVRALKSIFGEHANKLLVSSTKSMIGHLLGAAGAVETIFTVLALKDGIAPPTINLDNPDDQCDLDFVAHTAKSFDADYALCNSFGFGGTNGSLILKRV